MPTTYNPPSDQRPSRTPATVTAFSAGRWNPIRATLDDRGQIIATAELPVEVGKEVVVGRGGTCTVGLDPRNIDVSRRGVVITRRSEDWWATARSASGGKIHVPGKPTQSIPRPTDEDPDPAPAEFVILHGTVIELISGPDMRVFIEFDLGGRIRPPAEAHHGDPDLPQSRMIEAIALTPGEREMLCALVPDLVVGSNLGVPCPVTRPKYAVELLKELGTAFWTDEPRRKKDGFDSDRFAPVFDHWVDKVAWIELENRVPTEHMLRTRVDVAIDGGWPAVTVLRDWIVMEENQCLLAFLDRELAASMFELRTELQRADRQRKQGEVA